MVGGTLDSSINSGLIKLLYKGGDKDLIKNWRSITLLNVSYKVLAKILASRLSSILPKIINPTQTRFVKGRYILENLITCWETMEWARSSSQDARMFLIDYEKAYDRIEWEFIYMMLNALGFPSSFLSMVKVLMKDANAAVEVNGLRSQCFELSRSIRQGCPLAPPLFFVAAEALHYLLRDETLSQRVQGLRLPNGQEISNVKFVDDTAILFILEEDNMRWLMVKLDFFCIAYGSKILVTKSVLLG